jgi:hypothetical protein
LVVNPIWGSFRDRHSQVNKEKIMDGDWFGTIVGIIVLVVLAYAAVEHWDILYPLIYLLFPAFLAN